MRLYCTLILYFIYSTGYAARPDTAALRRSVLQLDRALVEQDSMILKKLLHKKLSYGHSNGWIETKRQVIGDLYNGKLDYHRIKQEGITIVPEEDLASVRTTSTVDVSLNGNRMQLKLHVLQVWIKEKKGWLLLSRQSTRVD